MKWTFDTDRPIYQQIVEKVKLFIVSGYYKSGDKLPSVRELAAEAEVNPNTMQKALAELEIEGLVYSNRTEGRYVTDNVILIESIKKEYAKNIISNAFSNLQQTGYGNEEILQLINEYMKGGTKNEQYNT